MARIDPSLDELCQKNPQEQYQVIIVLGEGSRDLGPTDLGLLKAERIGGLGMLKATLTGEQISGLRTRSEIEEIMPDSEVRALS